MNAGRVPDDERHRQAFFDSLVSGDAAHLPLCLGIALHTRHANARPGLDRKSVV